MTGSTCITMSAGVRQSLRNLEADLERARSDFGLAIWRAIPGADEDDIIIKEDGKAATIDMRGLRGLLAALEDAPTEIESALDDFGWRINQALKAFKQELDRKATP